MTKPSQPLPKHALITGGSSGIGLELAKMLARQGYNISILARRQNLIDQAISEIKAEINTPNQLITGASVDVTDETHIKKVIAECCEKGGDPDLLITSAGIVRCGYFENLTIKDTEEVMQINFFGTLYAIRSVLPYMVKNKRGQIVIISSAVGLMGLYGYSSYAPSKYALRGLADCLRAEMKCYNINISIVFPPNTKTPQLDYEHKHGIKETRVLSERGSTYSAEYVAKAIMKGIRKKKYAITPGRDITLLYFLGNLIIPLLNHFFDKTIKKMQGGAMDRAKILRVIQDNVRLILPQLKNEDITEDISLKELGANSLDRTEVAIQSMNELRLKIPLVELSKVKNIGDLVTIFFEYHEKL